MSLAMRIIPRLDIKGRNLVKGVQMEGVRVLGRPEDFARHYYEAGADELIYMDVVASLYGRNSLLDIVTRTSSEVFVPLTIGGGLRSLEDIRAALAAGADKVAINTAGLRRPDFIKEAVDRFGASTIVVSIEAKRMPDGSYEAYTDNGRECTGVDALAWARQASDLGAGEIMVTSVDREGTGRGFDVALIRLISESVAVPVIASGGAGCVAHAVDVVRDGLADALAVASLVHYEVLGAAAQPGSLGAVNPPANVTPASLGAIKEHLMSAGIECRTEECATVG